MHLLSNICNNETTEDWPNAGKMLAKDSQDLVCVANISRHLLRFTPGSDSSPPPGASTLLLPLLHLMSRWTQSPSAPTARPCRPQSTAARPRAELRPGCFWASSGKKLFFKNSNHRGGGTLNRTIYART